VSNQIVGVINLNEIVMGAFQSAYLGYYGMANFSRTGLMTDALRAAVGYAFNELGLHRLEANIQPDNLASIALVRRVGFKQEGFSPRYLRIDGEWRDHERWALLADRLD
jgi:ribosomal-protein-alanine N-acetyltransferase